MPRRLAAAPDGDRIIRPPSCFILLQFPARLLGPNVTAGAVNGPV
jgi:hypothetical protein